jgi:hypothetical protein
MEVGWRNMIHQSNSVLNPDFLNELDSEYGAKSEGEAYRVAILDTCNWGIKLSDTMLDLADTYRKMILVQTLYEAKRQLKEDLDDWIQEGRDKRDQKAINELSNHFLDLQEDLRFDVNMNLADYCNYKFYDSLKDETCVVEPKYNADLEELYDMMDRAVRDGGFWANEPGTQYEVTIPFTDTNGDSNCYDVTECPVRVLRDTGTTVLTVFRDEILFDIYYQYRIRDIWVYLDGVQPGSMNRVQIQVRSAGEFSQREKPPTLNPDADPVWHTFFSRPLSKLFTYEIGQESAAKSINLYCIDESNCKTITHRSPFTNWQLELRNMDELNLSGVNKIRIKFNGLFISDNYDEKAPERPQELE